MVQLPRRSTEESRSRSARRRSGALRRVAQMLVATGAALALGAAPALAATPGRPGHAPRWGAGVIVFTPSMPQSRIQAELTRIGDQQVPQSSQFDRRRYAIFFEPGTYGSQADPLTFQVGYYEQVAGLGGSPGDVVINGAAQVNNQCTTTTTPAPSGGTPTSSTSCTGLDNFWRSLSNLTLNFVASPTPPDFAPNGPETPACEDSNAMWAVSQAAPMRRVIVHGQPFLFDYCGNPSYVSGGFFADDTFSGAPVNGGQQQFFTRNSSLPGWSNGVWNQVFLGDTGAPATSFPGTNQYTTLPTTPVSEEAPFLAVDGSGAPQVVVPAPRTDSVGPDYDGGTTPGRRLPLSSFFLASPRTPVTLINLALARGANLIFLPGVYRVDQTIQVTRPDTVVMGLGFATLIPDHGIETMRTANVPGIHLSGLIFDAGRQNSPALLQVGEHPHGGSGGGSDPTLLSDVFFRIGGAEVGRATDALVVDTDHTILDDIWAWRADHGAGAGWTTNPSATGLVVNGDDVSAYGLAVEHFQKDEVVWNGQGGEDVFFQNEMPYDPPSQAAWMSSPTSDGYPAFRVADDVRSFQGWGMGSYSNFTNDVYSDEAFAAPDTPGVQWHDLLTVFLNGQGGIRSVIDGTGATADAGDQGTPQDVVGFP